jgi:arylformamidase
MDWDAAYDNDLGVPAGAPDYPAFWAREAGAFRAALAMADRAELNVRYGPDPRQRLDLFRPEGTPRGLAVFVHGGYWQSYDGSSWSHLAAGAVSRAFAVMVPTYRLCPEVRIGEIVEDAAAALAWAAQRVGGPIHLGGHSAGGHLVARLATTGSPLSEEVRKRLRNIVPISGLHDLRPLMRTGMNRNLRMDIDEARRESPALLEPLANISLWAWVGALERPELIRQTDLIANVWRGLGVHTSVRHAVGRHHYDVIEGLKDPDDPLTRALTGD